MAATVVIKNTKFTPMERDAYIDISRQISSKKIHLMNSI